MSLTVKDGFGGEWTPCEKHGIQMQVTRPGDARCPTCELESALGRAWVRAEKAEQELGQLRQQLQNANKLIEMYRDKA